MNLPYPPLLLLVAAAFYLGDSVLLLYADELVLSVGGRRWGVACPAGDWRLSGRIPYLPNPLTPHRTLFRARFDAPLPAGDPGGAQLLERRARALRWLGLPVLLLGGWLFLVLPLLAWRTGTGTTFLLALALAYGWILALVAMLVRRRRALGLDARTVAALAFDALACPPFAINLVRKISLRTPAEGDGVALSRARLDAAELAGCAIRLRQRITLLAAAEPVDGARTRQLQDYERALAALEP